MPPQTRRPPLPPSVVVCGCSVHLRLFKLNEHLDYLMTFPWLVPPGWPSNPRLAPLLMAYPAENLPRSMRPGVYLDLRYQATRKDVVSYEAKHSTKAL